MASNTRHGDDHSMSFLIPESIESPRLHLRTFRDQDWSGLHEYYADAECTRYTTLQPLSEEESRRMLAAMMRHWQRMGYGPYAVEDKASGSVLGIVGLWYPRQWPEPEIKWALARRHWGRGYAAEAARAVQAMAACHMPELHLISLIHRHNGPSIRLARAVGATLEKELPFRGDIYHVYRHPRVAP
jgi:RimJ/RimL family protein N-acetyltransferase